MEAEAAMKASTMEATAAMEAAATLGVAEVGRGDKNG